MYDLGGSTYVYLNQSKIAYFGSKNFETASFYWPKFENIDFLKKVQGRELGKKD